MHIQPVLLRRTGSALPSGSSHGERPSAALPPLAPGSGGHVNPDNAIPIADEDPGDFLSASTHKRKQSGIPLEAEEIVHRASVQTSLEQIVDEEEGAGEGGIQMSRSFSEADVRRGSNQPSPAGSSMPEFSDFFPDRESRWSVKSLFAPRGLALVAFLVMAVVYVFTAHPSSSSSRNNPAAGSSSAAGVAQPKPQNPESKEITYGEFHDEEVGPPMEHTPLEYNKIRFYDSPDKMKPMRSKGPIPYSHKVGGLHFFENVCLTNNVDALRYRPDPDTGLRGLIYFTDEEEVLKNPKRCVPCSNRDPLENWADGAIEDAKALGHPCGMKGLHAMFASSVGDWSECITGDDNARLMEKNRQTQSPVEVNTVHFFQEPTFLLQFDANNMERSLFDMLMTYLPHWDSFLAGEGGDEGDESFPFDSVISHSLQGCLSHSHNWFCEVLHQMYAFGEAKEIPWEGDDNTLYCYRELYYNQVGYQRELDHEGLVNRKNFGEFREMLFRKFGLPRRRTVEDRKRDAEYEKSQAIKSGKKKNKGGEEDGRDAQNNGDDEDDINDTKIIFYDNKLSDRTSWNGMETLISEARDLEKYSNIKFVTVGDFDELTVAQQARRFNEADAIIMAHGGHMANAIFAVDGTSFVEVGCKIDSLVGNPRFMALMDGQYRAVEKCRGKEDAEGDAATVCVKCEDGVNFTMAPAAFEQLIDDVVESLNT